MNHLEADEFWKNFEIEIGEKVREKTMGQHFRHKKDQGEWGLLVLTENNLIFRPTPGESWFDSLFRMATPKVPKEGKKDIMIPLNSIRTIVLPKKRFFDYLFSPPYLIFTLSYMDHGEPCSIILGTDTKCNLLNYLFSILPITTSK